MSLSIGIVGLPNVGKSTLFNAITNAEAEAANYPFCTIDPNTGIVNIEDERLLSLAKISNSQETIHSTITFTDIAGLVKGAAKGEGLGNKFLDNIRNTNAIAHVVRCFDDDNIIHVDGKVDPIADIETINLELILSDLEVAEKRLQNQEKKAKSGDKDEIKKKDLYQKVVTHLENNTPLRTLDLSEDEETLLKESQFITDKKVIYVANVSEDALNQSHPYVEKVRQYAKELGDEVIEISAQLEAEIAQLDTEEKQLFLEELGLKESGLNRLAKAGYRLLNLQSYLTTGPKESRAWTIPIGCKAPQAAGVIHTDFEAGFIRANIIAYADFIACNGYKEAKEKGLIRQEGKDYIVQDGDIIEFLFNV